MHTHPSHLFDHGLDLRVFHKHVEAMHTHERLCTRGRVLRSWQ